MGRGKANNPVAFVPLVERPVASGNERLKSGNGGNDLLVSGADKCHSVPDFNLWRCLRKNTFPHARLPAPSRVGQHCPKLTHVNGPSTDWIRINSDTRGGSSLFTHARAPGTANLSGAQLLKRPPPGAGLRLPRTSGAQNSTLSDIGGRPGQEGGGSERQPTAERFARHIAHDSRAYSR